jgi:hypothetical protein
MLGNDSRIIFEYKINGRELKKGDYFEYIDANGKYKTTYDYNEKRKGWVKRK